VQEDVQLELKIMTNDKFEICGFVKPGSGVNIPMKSSENEVMNLTKRDIMFFWGGANDVSKNNSEIRLSRSY
jgi:hypothetical protein